MNYMAVIGLVTFISTLISSVLVFVKNPRHIINLTWALFSLCLSCWGFGILKCFNTPSYDVALFWGRFLNTSGILVMLFLLHFCFAFVNKHKSKEMKLYYIIGIGYFLIAVVFYKYFVADVQSVLSFKFYPFYGPVYYIFPFYYLYFFLRGLVLLIVDFIATKDVYRKNHIMYIFAGFFLMFIGGGATFFPVFKIPLEPYGAAVIPFYVYIFAYAVIKHQLMDIRVAITRWTIFIIVYGSLLSRNRR